MNSSRRIVAGSRLVACAALAGAVAAACRSVPPNDPRVVAESVHALYGAARAERLSPPVASRFFAYATSAFYLGMVAGDPGSPNDAIGLNGLPELPRAAGARTDALLTGIAAQRIALDSLLAEALPTTRAAMMRLADSLDAARVAAGVDAAVADASRSLGRQVGLTIVAWSRADGFDSTRGRPYRPRAGRGLWVNDNPASTYTTQNLSGASQMVTLDNPANARRSDNTSDRGLILSQPKDGTRALPAVNMAGITEPYWGELRPFALERWDSCALAPYPEFSTTPGTPGYDEAREVYDVSRTLTAEQRAVALFWADNAGETGTPGGHWLSIASQMAGERGLGAREAARLNALVAVAVADAFIASWGYKFATSRIRPRTHIRMTMDPRWEPAIPTPPFPEYPSGHSAVSAAAAAALAAFLGDGPFDDSTSVSIGHPVRRFKSFTEAAHEAGQSRIYGGIHYASGNLGGRALGECVAAAAAARLGVSPPR